MSTSGRIARDTAVVMLLIFASRVLGFVRERAAAVVFGMNRETDAFRAAFNVPDLMFFLLVGGALNAAFIPVFTEYLAKGEEEEGWRLASTFFNLSILVLIASATLGIVFAPALAPLVAYDFTGKDRDLLVLLMQVMFPAVFFTALSGLATGIHRSYHKFTVAMTGPILYNIGITLGAYLLGPRIGIVGMAIGTVVGAASNFLIQLPFVIKKAVGYTFRIDLKHPALKRILKLMIPAIVSLSIFRINVLIGTNLASALPEGKITAIRIADQVIQFPLGVFAMGISMVIFPTLTKLAATGQTEVFVRTFSQSLRVIFFVTIPAGAGLLALGTPVIRLLFEAGKFTASDTSEAAYALAFFSFGLFAQSAIQILTQVFYSLQDTVTPVWVGALTVTFNTVLSIALLHTTELQQGALALAFAVSSIVNMLLYLAVLKRKLHHIEGTRMLRTVLGSAVASAVMAVVAYQVSQSVGGVVDLNTLMGRFTQVVLAIVAGAGVYAALTALMRMEEVQVLVNVLRKRRVAAAAKPTAE